jgi:phage terminase large subunit-like protein
MTHAETATQYAIDITLGKIPACNWIKLACQRHLDDLSRPNFQYIFSDAKANRFCDFLECLPHTKGKWAAKRELLKLQPWQSFIGASLFGWVDKDTGLRRFRECFLLVPRKNGKSPIAAGTGVYMTSADNEAGAEVVCGATTERQAWEVFRPAKIMVEKTPDLRKIMGFKVNAKSLVVEATGSRFEPVIGKPGDGQSISCGIADEFHEADTADLYDCFKTGMVGREQPLLMVITTAGWNIAGPCHDLQITAQRVLERSIIDERLFALIYTIDDGVDWTSELALRMANPNFGVSVTAETLLHDQAQAVQNASKANVFKTKHLNIWCSANSSFFNMTAWNKAADLKLNEAGFKDDPLYIGVDLASQIDLSAVIKVYVRRIDAKLHYYIFVRHYLPEDRISLPENQHYQKWDAGHHLIATDGAALDYSLVRGDLVADITGHNCIAVCYDQAYASQIMQELNTLTQVTLCEVPQRVTHLSLPMKALDAAILDGRIHHTGDPVLTWCMSNVVAHPDKNDNVFPNKQKPEYKIDGAVALITAMNRAITCDAIQPRSKFAAFTPFNL